MKQKRRICIIGVYNLLQYDLYETKLNQYIDSIDNNEYDIEILYYDTNEFIKDYIESKGYKSIKYDLDYRVSTETLKKCIDHIIHDLSDSINPVLISFWDYESPVINYFIGSAQKNHISCITISSIEDYKINNDDTPIANKIKSKTISNIDKVLDSIEN